MKSIGIITALDVETNQLLETFDIPPETVETPTRGAWRISSSDSEIFIIKSGVGKVCASMATQWLIDQYHPSLIINSGIAGSLSEDITTGTIILGTEFIQHDFMPAPWLNRPQGEVPFMGERSYPKSSVEISKVVEDCAIGHNLPTAYGAIVSGDEPIFDTSRRDFLKLLFQKFNPIAVDMESAAVAFVASENNTSFATMRVIADRAKHNDKPLRPGENAENNDDVMTALSSLMKSVIDAVNGTPSKHNI